jgi:hypothetical protein
MDTVVVKPYVMVWLHSNVTRANYPTLNWIRKTYGTNVRVG